MTATRACACDGKRAHANRASAERHKAGLVEAGASPDALNVYRCRHCGLFHVGHIVRRNGRRRRR